MIKTIDKAVEVLNKRCWRGERWAVHKSVDEVTAYATNDFVDFNEFEAITIARSLAGDYEALEARGRESRDREVEQLWDKVDDAHKVITSLGAKVEALEAENAELKAKLERVREAGQTLIAYWDAPFYQTIDAMLDAQDALRAALAETSEEKPSGDNAASIGS